MNVALRGPMSLAEFLAWEERQPSKHEFDGVRTIAMVGVTGAHAIVQANIVTALKNRLRGKQCQAFGSDLKIQVAGRIRYPDAFVVCSPVPLRSTVVAEPVIIFEILSESTMNEDLVVKNAEYRDTPSVRRYVILQQTAAAALVFSRSGAEWVASPIEGEGASLDLPEIDAAIPLAELFVGIDLSEAAEEA